MASFTTYDELPAGGVTGLFWPGGPSGFGDAEFDCEPFEFPMDPLYDPVESVIFEKGETTLRQRSFTYLVFDLTQYKNRTVKEAILSFEVAPQYTGKATESPTTNPILSVYDMHHAHENMIDDSKRHSFAGMVESPGSFPVEFDFPHSYTDYVPISGKVTASVIEDLGQEGNGYVGFLLSSENIDEEPGMQVFGMHDFKLEVDFGGTADIVPGSLKLYYPHVKTTGGWGVQDDTIAFDIVFGAP